MTFEGLGERAVVQDRVVQAESHGHSVFQIVTEVVEGTGMACAVRVGCGLSHGVDQEHVVETVVEAGVARQGDELSGMPATSSRKALAWKTNPSFWPTPTPGGIHRKAAPPGTGGRGPRVTVR